MLQQLRQKLAESQKNGWTFARNLLKVVIGEVNTISARTNKHLSDEEVQKIIRKLVVSNKETIEGMEKVGREKEQRYAILKEENEYLATLLPKMLSMDEIKNGLADLTEAIRNAKSDGQATGIAIKCLKGKGLSFLGDDVASVVKELRT